MEISKEIIDSMKLYKDRESKVHLEALKLVKNNSIVLSLGCGPGREVRELVRKNCKVTAIDINQTMIDESKKIEPNASYICMDCLKFKSFNSFDYIVCLWNTINRFSFEDKLNLIRLCYYNLKKDGKLIITTKNRYSSIRLFLKSFQNKFERTYYYNPKEIKYWFEDTHFNYTISKKDLGNKLIYAHKFQ